MDDMSELELTGLEEEYVVKVRGLIGWTVVSLPKMGSQKFEGMKGGEDKECRFEPTFLNR